VSEQSVYLNGRIVPAAEASVGVWDAGFLHGASTFTTMLARGGEPPGKVFRLPRHLARLLDTVELLGMSTDATAESLTIAVGRTLEANALADARVRVTLTPGSVRGDGGPTTLVTAQPLGEQPSEWYERGISVVVSSLQQQRGSVIHGYKTGCYLPRMLARQEAAAKGAAEALWFTTDQRLAEACFTNVFLVLDGTVRTPPLDTPVLPGIVREAVIELCGELEIDCDAEGQLTVHEMLAADEAFLTGSISGVRPVVRIERHDVGDAKPGPVTRRLMAAYDQLVRRECGID